VDISIDEVKLVPPVGIFEPVPPLRLYDSDEIRHVLTITLENVAVHNACVVKLESAVGYITALESL